jgi:predicted permease
MNGLRFALRSLTRHRGFALASLATLALGIGATTAIFTVMHAALLRPLPYREPEQLVLLWETHGEGGVATSEASYPDFLDWRASSTAFAGFEGYDEGNATVTQPDGAFRLRIARATSGFFALLGVTPALGRAFAPGEDDPGGTPVVVLTDRYWRRVFGADPAVIGRTLTLNTRAFEIIGVLPPGFQFAPAGDADLWIPIDRPAATRAQRFNHWLCVIGRLRDGVSLEAGTRELAMIMSRLAAEYPETNSGRGIHVVSLRDEVVGDARPVLLALLVAVGILLIIACANVTGLFLARALARARELAVRSAIGASRGRLVRQLVTESVVLAAGGAILGFALADVALSYVAATPPDPLVDRMPYLRDVQPDANVFLFTASLALLTAIGVGMLPAWLGSRTEAAALLAGAGRTTAGGTRHRLRDLLVAGQLALTAILLVAAALVGKSLVVLSREDAGFVPDHVLTATVYLTGPGYQDPTAQQRFFEQLLERARGLPGARQVGAVTNLPLRGGGTLTYRVEGRPEPDAAGRPSVLQRGVAGDYFQAMGIPLVAGRTFDARDDFAGTPVIVVNQSLARRLFPDGSAVGRRFRFYAFPERPWEIVGVVGDVKTGPLDAAPPPTVYYSHLQAAENELTLAIRSTTDPSTLAPGVRAIVRSMDPSLPVYAVATMNDVIARSFPAQSRRYSLLLIGAFGATALLLSVVGLYGVVALSVAQRARELGIRAALGATGSQLLGLVIRRATLLAVAGVTAGCLLALALGQVLSALLYQVRPTDPQTYVGVALLLGTIALLASAVPARRAARTNPATVLRIE